MLGLTKRYKRNTVYYSYFEQFLQIWLLELYENGSVLFLIKLHTYQVYVLTIFCSMYLPISVLETYIYTVCKMQPWFYKLLFQFPIVRKFYSFVKKEISVRLGIWHKNFKSVNSRSDCQSSRKVLYLIVEVAQHFMKET